MPFADDMDTAASHARVHPIRVARHGVQRHAFVHGVAQRLYGKLTLLRGQLAELLLDPIGYPRHLACSHITIVGTQ